MKKYTTNIKIPFTYVKNQPDAEDILQEVFIARLYKAPVFETDEHEKRWLIRVTVNYSKNYLKSFWHKKTDYKIDIAWEENSFKRELLLEVPSLPDKCKAPMYLHYYECYTCKEIGQMLGCKESAIKMRLKKGRELLKINLPDGGGLYESKRI